MTFSPSDAFLQSVLAAAQAYIMRVSSDLRIEYINQLQPGLVMEDVIGASIFDYVHPDYHDLVREKIATALETGEVQRYETRAIGPHGGMATYEVRLAVITPSDGKSSVCMTAVDVSEHVAREAALVESERKLRLALGATGIGLWSWDVTTGEVQWDERTRAITGFAGALALDSYTERLVHPDDRRAVVAAGEQTFASKTFVSVPHRIVREDRQVRWILTVGDVVCDDAGKPTRLLGGLLDITEQHMLEDQLRQAQKMEAIGNMTAGFAHNFNNILMIILSSLELLQRKGRDLPAEVLTDAIASAERGADLVGRLMTLARRRSALPHRVDHIVPLVQQAVRMCRSTFERHIELDSSVSDDVPRVRMDSSAIEQVLLNLLLNARDAVMATQRPARIAVSTDVMAGPSGSACVRIRVEDNGIGMSEDVRSRIFEPFFTTKSFAERSGLGLATSYMIVHEHGGTITCESTPDRGTVFSVCLPAVDAEVQREPPPRVEPTRTVATVLVVDDEEPIRRLVSQALETEGHRVMTAYDGSEARRVLERSGREVSLILLDRSMPGTPGEWLVSELRSLAPTAKIVFFTGQPVEDEHRTLVDGVLLKPVSMRDLLAFVGGLSSR